MGQSVWAIAKEDENFGSVCRNYRSLLLYSKSLKVPLNYAEPRNFKTKVFVFIGPTGSGKTRTVFDSFDHDTIWTPMQSNLQWFDGYMGHANVLLDDFDGCSVPFDLLLRLLDRYPMTVPVKGDSVNWRPRRFFITSNVDLDDWYTIIAPIRLDALRRRLDVIEYFPLEENKLINFDYE